MERESRAKERERETVGPSSQNTEMEKEDRGGEGGMEGERKREPQQSHNSLLYIWCERNK